MASFSFSLDLLKFAGAKCMIVDENGRKVNYVMVPIDVNEIKISAPRSQEDSMHATVRMNMWPHNEAYRAAIRQSKAARGDSYEEKDIPTHHIDFNHSEEYLKAWAAVPAVRDKVIKEDAGKTPDLDKQNPTDPNSQLYRMIRNRLNRTIANCYPIVAKQQQSSAPQNFGTPSEGTQFQQFDQEAYNQAQGFQPAQNASDDDLPF